MRTLDKVLAEFEEVTYGLNIEYPGEVKEIKSFLVLKLAEAYELGKLDTLLEIQNEAINAALKEADRVRDSLRKLGILPPLTK